MPQTNLEICQALDTRIAKASASLRHAALKSLTSGRKDISRICFDNLAEGCAIGQRQ